MFILNLLVNENNFSVLVERHRFLKSHDMENGGHFVSVALS